MIPGPKLCPACDSEPQGFLPGGGLRLVRCPRCGLAWQREFPDEAELHDLYGADYFTRWGADTPAGLAEVRAMKEASYAPFLDRVARHQPRGALLDVGCALGFLVALAERSGFDAYGLDLNESAVAQARGELGDRVRAGSLDASAFPGMAFDVVTLIDVFEHVRDPAGLLEAVGARLAPNGIAAAVLPNAASLTRRILGRRWPHFAPEHLFYWTPASLRRFLERRSWRVLELRTGIRKTYTTRYLHSYATALGRSVPALLARWSVRVRIPTGEMLAIARRDAGSSALGRSAAGS